MKLPILFKTLTPIKWGENGGKIRVWSLGTGKQLGSFTPPLPKKEDLITGSERASAPITLAVSNDGKMLLCGGYDDSFQSGGVRSTDGKGFKAWDLKTGKLIHNLSLGTSINALIISPDSKTFIAGGLGREIILRDIKTGKSGKSINIVNYLSYLFTHWLFIYLTQPYPSFRSG